MRLHGTNVRSVVLSGPLSPEVAMPEGVARHAEASLQAVIDRCVDHARCRDHYPDLHDDLAKLERNLDSQTITASASGQQLHLGRGVVGSYIRSLLDRSDTAADVPYTIHVFASEHPGVFAQKIVAWRVEMERAAAWGLYFSITCSEDFRLNSLTALRRDARDTLLGDYRVQQLRAACAVWPHAEIPANPTTSLLLALAAFALSYLARPVGALVLRVFADRRGRKAALMTSIWLMGLGTLAIAITPTYDSIGVFAPICIVLAGLAQGFSAGGEFGPAVALLFESSKRRGGLLASWVLASQALSTIMAAGLGVALSRFLSPAELQSWGWRVPFLFGLLIAPAGILLRRYVREPERVILAGYGPLRELSPMWRRALLIGIAAIVVSTSATYFLLYLPVYASNTLQMGSTVGFEAALLGGCVLFALTPIVGAMSDRIPRRAPMLWAALLIPLGVVPLVYVLARRPFVHALFSTVLCLAVLKALYQGGLVGFLAELFPPHLRASGINIAYNICIPIFGGLFPLAQTWLIKTTGDSAAPSLYLAAAALLSFASLVLVTRGGRRACAA